MAAPPGGSWLVGPVGSAPQFTGADFSDDDLLYATTAESFVRDEVLPRLDETEAKKQRYRPKLATGEWLAAYALTEPGAGSDALAGKTRATLQPDGKTYRLTGTKQFITNAGFADLFTVFAKVNGDKFTAFLVE